jgi:hypothetical protein
MFSGSRLPRSSRNDFRAVLEDSLQEFLRSYSRNSDKPPNGFRPNRQIGLLALPSSHAPLSVGMIQAKGPLMPSKAKERAERLFRQQQKGPKALADYRAKQEATRNLTAKLRAERLAREAINGKPKSERKKATRA